MEFIKEYCATCLAFLSKLSYRPRLDLGLVSLNLLPYIWMFTLDTNCKLRVRIYKRLRMAKITFRLHTRVLFRTFPVHTRVFHVRRYFLLTLKYWKIWTKFMKHGPTGCSWKFHGQLLNDTSSINFKFSRRQWDPCNFEKS